MLLAAQLDALVRAADGICNVVPLKGIALLQTLYRETLGRNVGDIDLLIWPKERARDFVNRLQADGYTPQFDFLADDATLVEKNKIALRSPRKERTDVDIHLAFITKKFFSHYCGNFNQDALARCRQEGKNLYYMDETDQWIFLAQHACFHLYRDEKWVMDLYLLRKQMNESQAVLLYNRAKEYGFQRINTLTFWVVNRFVRKEDLLNYTPPSRLWMKFTTWSVRHWRSWGVKHLVNPFWELIFIDASQQRREAHLHLVFPNIQQLKNIYRTKHTLLVLLLYPFHALLSFVGLVLFYGLFLGIGLFGSK